MKLPGRLGVAVGVLGLSFGWHVGWVSAPKEWQQATGWSRIPDSFLPGSDLQSSLSQIAALDAKNDSTSQQADRAPEISWLGHSGFVLRWRGQTVLLDPNLNEWCTISKCVLAERIDAKTIGPVDAVLISHPHFDHLDLPTLRSLSRIDSLVVPSGSEAYVSESGLAEGSIRPLQVGESTHIGPLEVIAVPAAHNGSRMHPLASKKLAVGYVVRAADFALYYSGDTGFSNRFEAIRDTYHPQVAVLPIGAYLPRIPMKYYHLSPEEAVEAAIILDVDVVIPCHFGTYTLSLDRPAWALPRFARAAREKGVEWRMPQLMGGGPVQVRHALATESP